jgi:hypothetical protein
MENEQDRGNLQMEWAVRTTESVFSSLTGDKTIYTIHYLNNPGEAIDDVLGGFSEFWLRILTVGPQSWMGPWEILLFEFWTESGLLSAVFTTVDRRYDDAHIFKVESPRIQHEYDALPEPLENPEFFQLKHVQLRERYWKMLRQTARMGPVPDLIACARKFKPMPIWGTYCYFVDEMFDLKI